MSSLQRVGRELNSTLDLNTSIYNIARELSSSLDQDRVLNEALNLIDWSIKITQDSILMVDSVTGNLVYRAAIGLKKPLPKGGILTQYRAGVGFVGKILQKRQPVIVDDLLTNEDWLHCPIGSQ